MIPADIQSEYSAPVSGIRYPELQPLLRKHNGRLVSLGYYPQLELNEGKWVLGIHDCVFFVFKPEDVLVVYGKFIDIWRVGEDSVYALLDALNFNSPVLSLLDSLEEPLL